MEGIHRDPTDGEPSMAQRNHGIPFRWLLPTIQLLVCFALLWPVRGVLFLWVVESIHSDSNLTSKSNVVPDASGQEVLVVPLSPGIHRTDDAAKKFADIRAGAPLALNFPVLVAQLPYILASPSKREWVPRGMPPETWRELSWPFLGILFWWALGRSVEAILAARRSVMRPRIGWIETGFALILLATGVVALIGILTGTPDDRRDLQFMTLLFGGLLWGVLATVTITARLLQGRVGKRNVRVQLATD
jgi:hypothetical protein